MNGNQNSSEASLDGSNSPASDIFALLDTDRDGFIHKEDFLDKMKTFTRNGDSSGKVAEEIEQFLGDDEWIDEAKFIEFYCTAYSADSNSSNRKRQSRVVYPGSLVETHVEIPTSPGDSCDTNDDIDWYEKYQEVYEFYEREKAEKDKLTQQEIELKRSYRQERSRADEIEAQLYDLRMSMDEQHREMQKNFENKMEIVEAKYENELQEYELKLTQLKKENGRLIKLSEANDEEMEEMRQITIKKERENSNLKSSLQEATTLHADYRQKSSNQMIELQAERDMLEIACKNMETQLLTMKHLPGPLATTRKSIMTTHGSQVIPEILGNTSVVTKSPVNSPTSRMGRSKSLLISMENDRTSSSKLPGQQISPVTVEINESDGSDLVHRLTMENKTLVERIAHLETIEFYQRQKLEAANCLSLAAELEQLNMEELKTGLTVERETVKTLQKYMNDLTTKLLLAGYIDVFEK